MRRSEPFEPYGGPLLRSTAVMATGTVVSRSLGFVRSAVWAWALGLNAVGAAYLVANTVPNIVFTLVAGGVLNAVLVPQLVASMRRDAADAYSDRLLTAAALVLVVVTALVTLAAPWLARLYAGGNWSEGDVGLTVALAYWCLPQVFFYGLFTMFGQVLNARGSFGPMMWAPVLNNVIAIGVGVAFVAVGSVDRSTAQSASASLSTGEIAWLGAGTTAGVVAQALVLLPALLRTGYRPRLRFDLRGAGLGRAGRLATWTLLFVLVNQVAYLVVARVANTAGKAAGELEGAAAGFPSYTNAYLVFLLPHGVVTVSVVSALLPRLSAHAATGEMAALGADLAASLRFIGLATVPAAAVFLALGPLLMRTVFFGNDPADAAYIGYVLMAFAPGLLAFSIQHVVLRAFYATQDTRTPFLIQCVVAGTNVGLVLAAGALVPAQWVVVGLAAAYSATYAAGLLVTLLVLRRRLPDMGRHSLAGTYLRLVSAAVPPALAAAWLSRQVMGAVGDDERVAPMLGALVGLAVMTGGYAGLACALRIPEAVSVTGALRRRFHRS